MRPKAGLLSWGSLRGALAVVTVLLIPDDVAPPGWDYDFSVKDFVSAITIGCINFTLLLKATTIGKVMNKLGIDALADYEEVGYYKSKALIFDETLHTLDKLRAGKKLMTSNIRLCAMITISDTWRLSAPTIRKNFPMRLS